MRHLFVFYAGDWMHGYSDDVQEAILKEAKLLKQYNSVEVISFICDDIGEGLLVTENIVKMQLSKTQQNWSKYPCLSI